MMVAIPVQQMELELQKIQDGNALNFVGKIF